MITTTSIFRGEHGGKAASVQFDRIGRTLRWHVTITVGRAQRLIGPNALDTSLRPCMSHATMLLDEHFPRPSSSAKTPERTLTKRTERKGPPVVRPKLFNGKD